MVVRHHADVRERAAPQHVHALDRVTDQQQSLPPPPVRRVARRAGRHERFSSCVPGGVRLPRRRGGASVPLLAAAGPTVNLAAELRRDRLLRARLRLLRLARRLLGLDLALARGPRDATRGLALQLAEPSQRGAQPEQRVAPAARRVETHAAPVPARRLLRPALLGAQQTEVEHRRQVGFVELEREQEVLLRLERALSRPLHDADVGDGLGVVGVEFQRRQILLHGALGEAAREKQVPQLHDAGRVLRAHGETPPEARLCFLHVTLARVQNAQVEMRVQRPAPRRDRSLEPAFRVRRAPRRRLAQTERVRGFVVPSGRLLQRRRERLLRRLGVIHARAHQAEVVVRHREARVPARRRLERERRAGQVALARANHAERHVQVRA